MTLTQIKLIIYACVVAGIFGLGFHFGGVGAREDLSDYKTAVAEKTARVADLATKTSELARKAERAKAGQIAAIAEQYEQDKKTNDRKQSDLVADLRAGNQRLHQRWQAAQATAKLSGAVAAAAELDAAQRDREGSAVRIIAAADQCDAQVRGLQEIIKADRR